MLGDHDVAIVWVELDVKAAPSGALADDDRGTRAEEEIERNIPGRELFSVFTIVDTVSHRAGHDANSEMADGVAERVACVVGVRSTVTSLHVV